MHDRIIVATVALIVLVGAASVIAFSLPNAAGMPHVSITSILTDKDTYFSKEKMQISIGITSSSPLDNVQMKVEGIQDRYGQMRLSEIRNLTLQEGQNSIVVDYTMPVCSACAGLKSGVYLINVTVSREGVPLAVASHSISIA